MRGLEDLGSVEPVEASRPGQAAHCEAELTVNLRALTNIKRRPQRFGEAQNKKLGMLPFVNLA
jgi:hypothetical protein